MENKFLTFFAPYLSFIDKGHMFKKPFSWLYALIAIINLLFPLYILFLLVDNDFFKYADNKLLFAVITIWVISAFAGWLSFQLWWDRKNKISSSAEEHAEFVATPVFSNLIQTMGEWIGTWFGIVGFGFALITTLVLDEYEVYSLDIPLVGEYLKSGWIFVFIMPIYGFLIIVITRFLAEQIKALSVIANNTKSK